MTPEQLREAVRKHEGDKLLDLADMRRFHRMFMESNHRCRQLEVENARLQAELEAERAEKARLEEQLNEVMEHAREAEC